jgi:O-methyltransferase
MKPRAVMQGNTDLSRRFVLKTWNIFDWICFFDRDDAKGKNVFNGMKTYSDIGKIRETEFDWLFSASVDILGVQDEYCRLHGVPCGKLRSIRYVHQLPKFNLFAAIANEIHRKGIEGDVAELGVNWGDTSKYINLFFYDRRLYCFDTFCGFSEKDESAHNAIFDHTATPELVMSKMPYPDMCIVKPGYFPESLDGLDGKFAFVHIDCDLHNPITAGLEYFYPRMASGGFICVHDYFNERFPEAQRAIQSFCDKNSIPFVPDDSYGGIVIAKR